jgi:hypothetical protein
MSVAGIVSYWPEAIASQLELSALLTFLAYRILDHPCTGELSVLPRNQFPARFASRSVGLSDYAVHVAEEYALANGSAILAETRYVPRLARKCRTTARMLGIAGNYGGDALPPRPSAPESSRRPAIKGRVIGLRFRQNPTAPRRNRLRLSH